MTKTTVKFVDELPTQTRGGGKLATTYAPVLAELVKHPGAWAEVLADVPAARRADVDKVRGYFRKNGAATETRRQGATKDEYRWAVYARIVK